MQQYLTRAGDTLDGICWRYYGRADAVVFVLEANPEFSDEPPVLPAGCLVNLPDLPAPDDTPVRLWN